MKREELEDQKIFKLEVVYRSRVDLLDALSEARRKISNGVQCQTYSNIKSKSTLVIEDRFRLKEQEEFLIVEPDFDTVTGTFKIINGVQCETFMSRF